MEKLPLTFVQAKVEPDIVECFNPAFNFTKINSSNGRLAFTDGKLYWLPDAPIAMLDQGWVIAYSEIASYGKFGLAGFSIKLVDGSELRFSNVGKKMLQGITDAIELHKDDVVAEPSEAPADAEAAPEAAAAEKPAAEEAAPEAAAAEAAGADPADASANKWMAVLAYFGILALIPLFAAKESKFARFHTNQGLLLLICEVVLWCVAKFIPSLAALVYLVDLVVLVFAIMGIVNALKGREKPLPWIGKIRIIE